ncbi:hypothetical protein ACFJGW_20660 [Burkholderiaceae bacterium UC74_6]
MEIVARHLQQEAIRRGPADAADLFGRSAFNRYYYATFLEVKGGLGALRDEWTRNIAHADLPQILRGQVKKQLAAGKRKAMRADDYKSAGICASADSAAEDLAKLLDAGRATRVTADYHPEIPVDFASAPDFQLDTVGVQAAQTWPHRARGYLQVISNAWRQIHA